MTMAQERTDPSAVESDDAPAWRGAAVSAPIRGHAHSTTDGQAALAPADQETAAESCPACQHKEVCARRCGGSTEASTAGAAYGPDGTNASERANNATPKAVTTLAGPAGSKVE